MVILAWLLLLFWQLFLLIIYISLAFLSKFFKVGFLASLSNKYIKTWYFHDQYKTNGLGTNEISYIFDLRHMSILSVENLRHMSYTFIAAYFHWKTQCSYIRSSIQGKRLKKILKNEAAEPYLEPCQISMMERFCENTTAKSFIIDV